MDISYDFRIIIIDDNIEIHNDFKKILIQVNNEDIHTNFLSLISKDSNKNGDDNSSNLLPNFKIDTATQGKEGFEQIKKAYHEGKPYALAFVDIRMPPGWDGIETIKQIWNVDKQIQVVICSAYSDYSWEDTIKSLGKSDNLLILKKPFDYVAVRQLAYSLTKKWQLMQEERNYRHLLEERVRERTMSLEKLLSVTRATLESSADGIVVVDLDNQITDYNSKFIDMWKIPDSMSTEKNWDKLKKYISQQINHPNNFFENKAINEKKVILDTLYLTEERVYEVYRQPHTLHDQAIGRVWSFRDVTKRVLLEKELQYKATHDILTDLPNRMLLESKINQAIEHAAANNTYFALLFLDLDRFKLINDSLSHAAGDELLRSVAKRILKSIRPSDTLARLGGDEFVVVVDGLANTNKDKIARIAEHIIKRIHEPFLINTHIITVSTSIGISVYPNDGDNIETLLKHADAAMYYAKDSGSDQFQFYNKDINPILQERFELEFDLRNALLKNEFILAYQPQYKIEEKKLIAVEALIRWNHPKKGLLLPCHFVPFAETVGLIIPIGEWVLRAACKQLKAWHDAGYPKIRVAVNMTSLQLRQYNIVNRIQAILNESGLEGKYLELELTENSIINNPYIIESISALKKLGVFISLDDFGSGYSTINHLKNLSLDRLKIDRSFVQNILINRGDEAIIQAIIDMSKAFNLEVIAEGVENQNQINFLKERNCNEVQGYFYSEPVSHVDIEELLKKEQIK